ncbi:MAG: hypothetical protein IMY72_00640 [Bacteroidetes bacterium]|nr:hypothetical protein [Bacteroidota bacterium]
MNNKILLTIILLASIVRLSYSQNISNIDFQQNGQKIMVSYKLSLLAYNEKATISVFVSMDGGNFFIGPLKEVTGDVGENVLNGNKTITWEAFKEIPNFSGNIVFDIRANVKMIEQKKHFYIAYTASLEAPMGITLGILNRWGYYLSTRINPTYFTSSFFETDGETIPDYNESGYYSFNGNQTNKRLALTVGISRQVTKNLHWYVGGGYANYELLWEIDQFDYQHNNQGSAYAKHNKESFSSFELEIGVKAQFSKLIISAGASTPAFNWYEFVGSIGLVF